MSIWLFVAKLDIWTASGFLDMLTRAQCCRVDDQRGLLTKEQLEVPSFLQLPPDERPNTEPDEPGTSSCAPAEPSEESVNETSAPSKPSDAAKETADSAEQKPKDVKETTVWKTCDMDRNMIKTHVPNHVKRPELL